MVYEIKTEDVYEDFSKNREIFDFSNYSAKSKCHDDSNKLVSGKMKDDINISVKELVGLKPKKYSFLVDHCSEHKQAESANKNTVATISHNKYKDVLVNNKCLSH